MADESILQVLGRSARYPVVGIADLHHGHGELYAADDGRLFGRSCVHDAFWLEGGSFSVGGRMVAAALGVGAPTAAGRIIGQSLRCSAYSRQSGRCIGTNSPGGRRGHPTSPQQPRPSRTTAPSHKLASPWRKRPTVPAARVRRGLRRPHVGDQDRWPPLRTRYCSGRRAPSAWSARRLASLPCRPTCEPRAGTQRP